MGLERKLQQLGFYVELQMLWIFTRSCNIYILFLILK